VLFLSLLKTFRFFNHVKLMKKSEVPNGVEDKADNDCLPATLTLIKK
jgi:hypothetical protein